MKHTHEVFKFDVLEKTAPGAPLSSQSSPPCTPPQMSPTHSPPPVRYPGPPNGQYMFRNPYTDQTHTYIDIPESDIPSHMTYANPYKEQVKQPEGMSTQPTAPPLSAHPSPHSLAKVPAVPALTPKNPPETLPGSKNPLPEPLKPDVLPEGKIAAIKTVAKHHRNTRLLDLAVGAGYPEGAEEER